MTSGAAPDLIAVLLVTASASGANLVFRWPPTPRLPVRFSRPKPLPVGDGSAGVPAQMLIDAAYGCSHNLSNEAAEQIIAGRTERSELDIYADENYLWHRSGFSSLTTNPSAADSIVNNAEKNSAKVPDGSRPITSFSNDTASGSDSVYPTTKPNTAKGAASADASKPKKRGPSSHAKYDELIGYEASFLAELLSPVPSMCHQKFELVVDELAFIGHPVHAKIDGSWDFAELSGRPLSGAGSTGTPTSTFRDLEPGDMRGRVHDRPGPLAPRAISQQPRQMFQIAADDGEDGDTEEMIPTRPRRPSLGLSKTTSRSVSLKSAHGNSMTPASPTHRRLPSSKASSLQLKSFHLILVLDRPDPSSLASTDLDRYIDAYYTQFAFKLTAAMLYEQGRSNYIAEEAHNLLTLKEKYLSTKSVPPQADKEFDKFFERALRESPLASAIRTAYETVVSSSICQVMINTVPVNIQLPPGHLDLLKVGNAQGNSTVHPDQGWGELEQDDNDEEGAGEERLEDEVRFGWKVPSLRPWKTVALLDHAIKPTDIAVAGRRAASGNSMVNPAETLPRFTAAASPTMTLYAIAQVMKVDLETELYSLVRLLVYNRKAKILDVVRMVNVYTLPSIFPRPLYELSEQFAIEFPTLSPLPILLSALSVSHRTFASIVGPSAPSTTSASPSALEAYTSSPQRSDFFRVLIWMLTHDLLVMLHVRVRIYIPKEIKDAALRTQKAEKEQRAVRKAKKLARGTDPHLGKDVSMAENVNGGTRPILKTSSSASIRSSASRLAPDSRSTSPDPSSSNHLSRSRSHSFSQREARASHLRHKHGVSFDKIVSIEKTSIASAPASHGESSSSTLNDEDEDLSEEDNDESDDDDDHGIGNSALRSSDPEVGSGDTPGKMHRESKQSSEVETSELEEEEDHDVTPSFLIDPERATRAQRRWLDEICKGHDSHMVKGFRRITPYLDGKTTTDEIMYRTGMSRGQLREILRHFDAHLTLLLHP